MITQEDKKKAAQLIQGIIALLKSLEEIVNKGAIPICPPTDEEMRNITEEMCNILSKSKK